MLGLDRHLTVPVLRLGGAMRAVLESVGITDVFGKI